MIGCKQKTSDVKINEIVNTINNNLKVENEKLKVQLNKQRNETKTEQKVIPKKRTKVYVDNTGDFFNNLHNDTEIILTMDTLNLSTQHIKQYLEQKEDYKDTYRTKKLLVDNQLILSNFENLVIKSFNKTNIIVDNTQQNLLTFHKSKQIEIYNVKIFHLPTGYCRGEVFIFIDSEDIKVKNCELNGSGSVGLHLNNTTKVLVENFQIYNNSRNAVVLNNSNEILINESRFYNNNGSTLISMTDSECNITNSNFSDNTSDRLYLGLINSKRNTLYYNNCNFDNNNFEYGFDDFDLTQRNDSYLPSFYSEEGMVYSYFQAENSRDIDKILSFYANNIDYYYNLEIVGERKDELISEYKKSWELLMYSKNKVLEVKTEYNRNPEAINVFSFVKYSEPYTIYRIKNKIELTLGEQGKEPQKTNNDGYYEDLDKVNNVRLLETEKLKPININFEEVKGIDDEEIERILKSYRETTYFTVLNNYFNGETFKNTINIILKNREFEQEMIVRYRQSPNTSKNDHQKIIDYIISWSEITNELSTVWDN